MENKKGERRQLQGRNVLESFFEFYALLATLFSLTIGHAQQRGARRYVRTFITVLTALTIHLFHVENFFVAFLRVSQRAFWSKRFLCYLPRHSKIFWGVCLTSLFDTLPRAVYSSSAPPPPPH